MSGDRKSVCFHKLIMDSSIVANNKMRIPNKFGTKFGDELSSIARLIVPNGPVWHVGLEKTGNKFWFQDGWQVFVKYYSITAGYFLIFKYEGQSNFNVYIFDLTTAEINYQPKTPSSLEEHNQESTLEEHKQHGQCPMSHEKEMEDDDSVEILGSSHPSLPRTRLENKSEMSDSQSTFSGKVRIFRYTGIQISESELKKSTDEVALHLQGEGKDRFETSKRQTRRTEPSAHEPLAKRKKETEMNGIKANSRVSTRKRAVTPQEKQCAIDAAITFKPGYPFCRVIMQPSYVYRGFVLHMPFSFTKKYMSEVSGMIKLQDSDGKQWSVRCVNNADTIKLSKGWHEFVEDNSLEEGDVCIFEQIQMKDIVLKVTIFRVLEDTVPQTQSTSK